MGVADFVSVVVSLTNSKSPTRQGFGTPLLLAFLSAAAVTANPARFRIYPSGSALTEMVSDGILTTDPAYRAMEVALAQSPCPAQIALGRRTLPMTQVLKFTFTDTSTAGDIEELTVVGSDGVAHTYSQVASGTTATDAASFAALMTASNIGTVTVSGSTVTITQAAGKLTDLQTWSPSLQISNTTADPGIATDLAAVVAADNLDWYGLSLDSNSKAEVLAAAAFVEATGVGGKFGFYDNSDHANCTAGGGDLDSTLQSETYKKTWLSQSNSAVLSYLGFGLASLSLASSPGSWAGSYKAVAGVLADTDQSLTETQRLVLNTASTSNPGTGGKNGNWYATVAGLNTSWPGVTPSGEWADIVIFIDWLQANLQADIFAVLAGQPGKVAYTDTGIGLILAAIKSRLKIGGSPPYGGIDLTQPVSVLGPSASAVSPQDKANRNLSGISATAFLSGAINTAGVAVSVTQ